MYPARYSRCWVGGRQRILRHYLLRTEVTDPIMRALPGGSDPGVVNPRRVVIEGRLEGLFGTRSGNV
jgi:hypothetical protein